MGWAVPARWGDHDASLGEGERIFKANLQDRKYEAIGSSNMVGKHSEELFCRRKGDDRLSFEQVQFEEMVAHPRDGIKGPGLYTQIRDSVK